MTAPLAVATTSDVADFYPGNGLPTITPSFQQITDQTILDAVVLVAGRAGVRLRFSTDPAPPAVGNLDPQLVAALQAALAGSFAPAGSVTTAQQAAIDTAVSGLINKPTAQGVALVQALIFGS